MWVAVVAIGAVYVLSTALTPLYPLYRRDLGISELAVTAIYAIYVLGNLAILFTLGRASDQIGRRPTAILGLLLAAGSAVCFFFAMDIIGLGAGRVINGLAAGLGAGALTAWIAELEPRRDQARAAVIASAGNLGGLAAGSLGAGLLAQYAPWPLRLVFAVCAVVLCGTAFCMRTVPETVKPVRDVRSLSLQPRIGVPRGIRLAFAAPACMTFTAFALGGFYAAVVPGLMAQRLHVDNVADIGAVVALFFGVACATAMTTSRVKGRAAMYGAVVLVVLGLTLLVVSEQEASVGLLLAATLLAGAAMALGYRGSLEIVNEIAPAERRAEVICTYLLVCYSANSLPVLGVGLLSLTVGPLEAHLSFAIVIAVLAVIATGIGARFLPREGSQHRTAQLLRAR
jgi:MFS family permease